MKTVTQRQQEGYVLPLTLAVLVMLTLIAAQVGSTSRSAIDQVMQSRQRVQAQYALTSAKAQVLHLLAVIPRTRKGLGDDQHYIVPDDRPYILNEQVKVRFQDLRGLLPLNPLLESQAADERLRQLLRTYGLQATAVDTLMDALKDYRDTDRLRRNNGAEAPDYEAAGQLRPRDADLQDPQELLRVLGWSQVLQLWQQDGLLNYTHSHRVQAFNPNTAPPRVLAAVSGVSLEQAQELVRQRQASPDVDIAPLLFPQLGDPFGASGFVVRGTGASVRVTLEHRQLPWALQMVVHHTPEQMQYPWRISHHKTLVHYRPQDPDPSPVPLPSLAQLRPLTGPRLEYRF